MRAAAVRRQVRPDVEHLLVVLERGVVVAHLHGGVAQQAVRRVAVSDRPSSALLAHSMLRSNSWRLPCTHASPVDRRFVRPVSSASAFSNAASARAVVGGVHRLARLLHQRVAQVRPGQHAARVLPRRSTQVAMALSVGDGPVAGRDRGQHFGGRQRAGGARVPRPRTHREHRRPDPSRSARAMRQQRRLDCTPALLVRDPESF